MLTDCDRTVCTFPLEYCEFGSHITKCKEWLKEEHPDLYDRYYSDGQCLISVYHDTNDRMFVVEALQAKVGTLSLEAQSKLEKDTAKKEAKAEAKADAAMKKKMVRVVRLSSLTRPLTHHITSHRTYV